MALLYNRLVKEAKKWNNTHSASAEFYCIGQVKYMYNYMLLSETSHVVGFQFKGLKVHLLKRNFIVTFGSNVFSSNNHAGKPKLLI